MRVLNVSGTSLRFQRVCYNLGSWALKEVLLLFASHLSATKQKAQDSSFQWKPCSLRSFGVIFSDSSLRKVLGTWPATRLLWARTDKRSHHIPKFGFGELDVVPRQRFEDPSPIIDTNLEWGAKYLLTHSVMEFRFKNQPHKMVLQPNQSPNGFCFILQESFGISG